MALRSVDCDDRSPDQMTGRLSTAPHSVYLYYPLSRSGECFARAAQRGVSTAAAQVANKGWVRGGPFNVEQREAENRVENTHDAYTHLCLPYSPIIYRPAPVRHAFYSLSASRHSLRFVTRGLLSEQNLAWAFWFGPIFRVV